MKQILGIIHVLCLLAVSAQAQYQVKHWATGIQIGEPTGINIKKYYLTKKNAHKRAWCFTLGSSGHMVQYQFNDLFLKPGGGVGMFNYLFRIPVSNREIVEFYAGGGIQAGIRKYFRDGREGEVVTKFGTGLTGALGIDYFIPNAPVTLFAEINPYLEIYPKLFGNPMGGVGARFMLR